MIAVVARWASGWVQSEAHATEGVGEASEHLGGFGVLGFDFDEGFL